jgi:hypothetical protein
VEHIPHQRAHELRNRAAFAVGAGISRSGDLLRPADHS